MKKKMAPETKIIPLAQPDAIRKKLKKSRTQTPAWKIIASRVLPSRKIRRMKKANQAAEF